MEPVNNITMIHYNLYQDLSTIIRAYDSAIKHCEFIINEKSSSEHEKIEYGNKLNELNLAIKQLNEFIGTV